MPRGRIARPLEERFWENVYKTDNCWFWIGYVGPDGYGRMGFSSHFKRANRVSWVIHSKQEIPDGFQVCHTCDTPACVRPDHLFLGTPSENSCDMVAKGRGRSKVARGSKIGIAKLREKQIPLIRLLKSQGHSNTDIAKRYGVDPSTISVLFSGKTWTHVSNSLDNGMAQG